jgi:hypothetical protein
VASEAIDWWAVVGGTVAGAFNPLIGVGTYAAIEAENDRAAAEAAAKAADEKRKVQKNTAIKERKLRQGKGSREGRSSSRGDKQPAADSSTTTTITTTDEPPEWAFYAAGAAALLVLLLPP